MDFRNLEMVGRWSSYLWVGAELPVTVVGRGRWWVGGELGRATWRLGRGGGEMVGGGGVYFHPGRWRKKRPKVSFFKAKSVKVSLKSGKR